MEEKKTREAPTKVLRQVYCLDEESMARLKTYRKLYDDVSATAQVQSFPAYNDKDLTDKQRRECLETAEPFSVRMKLLRRLISIETVRLHEHTFTRIRNVFEDSNEPDAAIIAEVLEEILQADKRHEEKLESDSRAERMEDF